MIALSCGLAAVTIGIVYFREILRHLRTWQEGIARWLGHLVRHPNVQEYQILYERNTDAKVVKSSRSFRPVHILRDPDLIKSVVLKDFEYFTDRPSKGNTSELFDLNGGTWRDAKEAVLPIFSPEPLKGLFEYFTANLGTLITRITQKASPVDVSEPVKICVSDIYSLAVFGVKITIGLKKDEFTSHALSVIADNPLRRVKSVLFGHERLPPKADKYFKDFLSAKFQSSINPANTSLDIVQLLSLASQKKIPKPQNPSESSEQDNFNCPPSKLEEDVGLPEDFLHDAVLQFLTSGFEPIVSAITFVLYDLSRQPDDVQTKLRDEIVSSLMKNSGYNYDAIREMRFLDCCICESLRLHPPVHTVRRSCVKDYASEDGIFFNQGDSVVVPILGVHMDNRHFPEPENYMPQRFDTDESRKNLFYMPYGIGPRKCLGEHFAQLVIKTMVAKLVHQFKFTLSEESAHKSPHRLKGPYIVPNGITFNIQLAQKTSLLK